MALSRVLGNYLCQAHVEFDTVCHPHTENAFDSATSADVPPSQMAKAVVTRDMEDGRYVMALIPSCNRLKLKWLNRLTDRHLNLIGEEELNKLFPDCESGAVPGFGQAYNMEMVWDERLEYLPDVYLEGGDHESLIHIDHQQFVILNRGKKHGVISSSAVWFSPYHNEEIA